MQRHFHPGLAAPSQKAGGDHPGVVEDDDVAGAEEVGQVAHRTVAQPVVPVRRPARFQEPRRVLGDRGPLRDAFARQVEIEIIHVHRSDRCGGTPRNLQRFAAMDKRAAAPANLADL